VWNRHLACSSWPPQARCLFHLDFVVEQASCLFIMAATGKILFHLDFVVEQASCLFIMAQPAFGPVPP